MTKNAQFPFHAKTGEKIDDVHYRGEIELSLERHPFLRHHVLVKAPGIKPDTHCLPVLPLGMGVEALIETAAKLAGGRAFLGTGVVSAAAWIQLVDSDRARLVAHAEITSDAASGERVIAVSLRDPESDEPLLAGSIEFGEAYRQRIKFPIISTPIEPESATSAADHYASGELFHGPNLQCLEGAIFRGPRSIRSSIRVPALGALFGEPCPANLHAHPVVLDGMSQLLGVWGIGNGYYPFPIGIEAIEYYRAPPVPGSSVPVFIHVRSVTHRVLVGDVEVQDGEGNVWFRCRGLRMWCFHWTPTFHNFRCRPTEVLLSRVINSSPPLLAISKEDIEDGDLDQIARYYLTIEEYGEFTALIPDVELRTSWILRKIVAKDTARHSALPRHPVSFSALTGIGDPVEIWESNGVVFGRMGVRKDEALELAHTLG